MPSLRSVAAATKGCGWPTSVRRTDAPVVAWWLRGSHRPKSPRGIDARDFRPRSASPRSTGVGRQMPLPRGRPESEIDHEAGGLLSSSRERGDTHRSEPARLFAPETIASSFQFTKNGAQACDSARDPPPQRASVRVGGPRGAYGRARRSRHDEPERHFSGLRRAGSPARVLCALGCWSSFRARMNESAPHWWVQRMN
jgi:hypothetical protein